MQKVLLITGACGVGKTTLARAWARRHQGAIIETDYLTEWVFKEDFPQWTPAEERFTARASALLAVEYLREGMPVAIENVWSPEGMNLIRAHLRAADEQIAVQAVWLFCDLPENQRRDQERIPENQMLARVAVVKRELEGYDWPAEVHRMDTMRISVEETLDIIEGLKAMG
ncbi:AAA family ATPase [Lewinella sp. W8]|uniref:AAA family ATPase n=1 Tax=Lewinella sp. W8 TaxID=2528208 RepID=UPI0010686F2F|nr:AAA family ATPase [Lewinella sp. W8]MTB53330.1 AAA family ATPase [Lewinella sp. W8]